MWIDSTNFDMLKGLVSGSKNLLSKAIGEAPQGDIKVAYDDLTKAQKAQLVNIEGDFKIYVHGRMPTGLDKDKLIKEPYFTSTDLIAVVKACLKKSGRELYDLLVEANISPVVLSQWLIRPCSKDNEALEILVQMESYVYQKDVYFSLLASSGLDEFGLKFAFPKKVRE